MAPTEPMEQGTTTVPESLKLPEERGEARSSLRCVWTLPRPRAETWSAMGLPVSSSDDSLGPGRGDEVDLRAGAGSFRRGEGAKQADAVYGARGSGHAYEVAGHGRQYTLK
jgi:hypothetical protein